MARGRVRLHTGNPSGAYTPPWGGRDVKGSNPEFTQARPAKKPRTSACQWCGSTSKVDASSPRRCKRCTNLEKIIAEATRYLALRGLRPLGGSLAADSAAEAGRGEEGCSQDSATQAGAIDAKRRSGECHSGVCAKCTDLTGSDRKAGASTCRTGDNRQEHRRHRQVA